MPQTEIFTPWGAAETARNLANNETIPQPARNCLSELADYLEDIIECDGMDVDTFPSHPDLDIAYGDAGDGPEFRVLCRGTDVTPYVELHILDEAAEFANDRMGTTDASPRVQTERYSRHRRAVENSRRQIEMDDAMRRLCAAYPGITVTLSHEMIQSRYTSDKDRYSISVHPSIDTCFIFPPTGTTTNLAEALGLALAAAREAANSSDQLPRKAGGRDADGKENE
jgi:hypothetical protein